MSELRLVPPPPSDGSPPRFHDASALRDDYGLIAGIKRGEPAAASALYDRYHGLVERTLGRILGVDSELQDTVQETFIRALGSFRLLRDPQALPSWMIRIAVCTASDLIRRRRRTRLFHLFAEPAEVVDAAASVIFHAESDIETRRALVAAQAVLNDLPLAERIAFALRRLEGMELKDVANACSCSLATIKRRLVRAEARFLARAQKQPELKDWLDAKSDDKVIEKVDDKAIEKKGETP